MNKCMLICFILMLSSCTFGGNLNAGGGSNGVGLGIGLGTGIRF